MIRTIAVAVALAAVVAGSAFAQQSPPTPEDQVVVQGRRAEDAVREFVAEVGAAPRGSNLARWDRRVCVGVVNVTTDYAQKLIDEVSLAAVKVGLEPGEPGCRANVLILASNDGDALAERLVADTLRAFRPADASASNLGRDALRRFQTSDAPVRWWHVSKTVAAETGVPILDGQSVRVRGASRVRSNVREEMAHVVIILDTSKIGVVSFASLADYVSMVALAQVDADADMQELPTVLNLFTEDADKRTARMTQWDIDYLTALYAISGDAPSPSREAQRLERQMLEPKSTADGAGH